MSYRITTKTQINFHKTRIYSEQVKIMTMMMIELPFRLQICLISPLVGYRGRTGRRKPFDMTCVATDQTSTQQHRTCFHRMVRDTSMALSRCPPFEGDTAGSSVRHDDPSDWSESDHPRRSARRRLSGWCGAAGRR